MKKILVIFGFASLLVEHFAYSGSIFETKIKSYQEIHAEVQRLVKQEKIAPEKILVVSDWDNVVTERNGMNHPFREGGITAQTIQDIVNLGAQFFVLTARAHPDSQWVSIDSSHSGGELKAQEVWLKAYREAATAMHDAFSHYLDTPSPKLSSPMLSRPSFKSEKCTDFSQGACIGFPVKNCKDNDSSDDKVCAFYIQQGIVFSGYFLDDAKGLALEQIISLEDYLNHRPEWILFVDDNQGHLDGMRSVFENREEKLHLFHFPVDEVKAREIENREQSFFCRKRPRSKSLGELWCDEVLDWDAFEEGDSKKETLEEDLPLRIGRPS